MNDFLEVVLATLALVLVLGIKPLVWTPLLFGLDRLAGLVGPRFRQKVSGHYAGQPLRYFYMAQSLGPIEARRDLEERRVR